MKKVYALISILTMFLLSACGSGGGGGGGFAAPGSLGTDTSVSAKFDFSSGESYSKSSADYSSKLRSSLSEYNAQQFAETIDPASSARLSVDAAVTAETSVQVSAEPSNVNVNCGYLQSGSASVGRTMVIALDVVNSEIFDTYVEALKNIGFVEDASTDNASNPLAWDGTYQNNTNIIVSCQVSDNNIKISFVNTTASTGTFTCPHICRMIKTALGLFFGNGNGAGNGAGNGNGAGIGVGIGTGTGNHPGHGYGGGNGFGAAGAGAGTGSNTGSANNQ